MSGETTQRSGFDMKSAQLPVVAFALRSADLEQLAQEFAERFGSDSTFFDHDPVLIDLAHLREADEDIDFVALVALLRQYRTTPVAVRGGSEAQMASAYAAGLMAAPEAPPARKAAEPEVREVKVEVIKEVQLPAKASLRVDKPMRSGQQVYAAGSDVIVNAIVSYGAEVIADGNVHVYGPLRGRAVAGARGDKTARIYCTCFEPQLVSIAGIYRTVESDWPAELAGKAAVVRLEGEKLLIEPL
ncbi:septum site-determining protein MinC [Comamonas sp. BIGb0152]|uniref:septum site-determining protein MinC n=1 Tax=Comamonas sp. BIGb0152 TaxID=2940601 RepID=UPI002169CA3E|nr:septum site-determining protein MinC [Comamonas sp. BIGb0152]MCS4294132.1 septum site-determining protein MinC [Comamonas sp. BIGb0152]